MSALRAQINKLEGAIFVGDCNINWLQKPEPQSLRNLKLLLDEAGYEQKVQEVSRLNRAAKAGKEVGTLIDHAYIPMECRSCLLYTSPSPRDLSTSRMPSSA